MGSIVGTSFKSILKRSKIGRGCIILMKLIPNLKPVPRPFRRFGAFFSVIAFFGLVTYHLGVECFMLVFG